MAEENQGRQWLTVVIAVVVIIIGIYVSRKTKLFSKENEYYAYYYNVKGLQASSAVLLKGVRIGKITTIDLNGGGKVKVTLRINKNINLPEGTHALLASGNILGDKVIRLMPGNGPGNIPDFATLPTAYDTSVMQASVQIQPYLESGKLLLMATDSSLRAYNQLVRGQVLVSTTASIISFEQTMSKYAGLAAQWNKKGDAFAGKVENLHASTTRQAANADSLTKNINNIEVNTRRASNKPIIENVANLNKSIKGYRQIFDSLNARPFTKTTYNNMTNKLDTLNQGWEETYRNPKGIGLFGKKKKK